MAGLLSSLRNVKQLCVGFPVDGPADRPGWLRLWSASLGHVVLPLADPEGLTRACGCAGRGLAPSSLSGADGLPCTSQDREGGHQRVEQKGSHSGAGAGGSRSSDDAPQGLPIPFPGHVLQALTAGLGKSYASRRHRQTQERGTSEPCPLGKVPEGLGRRQEVARPGAGHPTLGAGLHVELPGTGDGFQSFLQAAEGRHLHTYAHMHSEPTHTCTAACTHSQVELRLSTPLVVGRWLILRTGALDRPQDPVCRQHGQPTTQAEGQGPSTQLQGAGVTHVSTRKGAPSGCCPCPGRQGISCSDTGG